MFILIVIFLLNEFSTTVTTTVYTRFVLDRKFIDDEQENIEECLTKLMYTLG